MSFGKRLLILSLIGFGVGVIAGTLIAAISGTLAHPGGTLILCSPELIAAVGSPLAAFTIQAVVLGLHGALALGGSVVYGIETWSITRRTITHYLIVIVDIYILAFTLKWFSPGDFRLCLNMFLMMTPPYILIWLINYIIEKKQRQQNDDDIEEVQTSE